MNTSTIQSKARKQNTKFEIRGVNHLALTCKDMKRTVDFYSGVLGMPLTKTIDLPRRHGSALLLRHRQRRRAGVLLVPGRARGGARRNEPGEPRRPGPITTANATMNHVAFDVSPDKIDEYRERLVKAGVDVTPVVNHDASETQASKEITPTTFVRSIYFLDPDGIQLEFAAWTRELDESDVNCEPHSTAAR